MKIFLDWAYKAAIEHEAVIGLLALAFVVTMPAALPWPLSRCEPLEWVWEWVRDGLKAFVSFRSPLPPGKSTSVTDTRIHSEEATPAPTAEPQKQ